MEVKPDAKVISAVKRLDCWEINGRELTKRFRLKDFSDAVRFIGHVSKVANKLDHHPDVLLCEFRNVRLFIKTNEYGTITMKDVEFAKLVDAEFKKMQR